MTKAAQKPKPASPPANQPKPTKAGGRSEVVENHFPNAHLPTMERLMLRAGYPQLHPDQSGTGVNIVDDGRMTPGGITAAIISNPDFRHADLQRRLGVNVIAGTTSSSVGEGVQALQDILDRAEGGENSVPIKFLTSQAVTLDLLTTNLISKAISSEYLDQYERWMRMALKAQAASRVNLEALARIQRGGEQVVRHVHVNEGGQAVIAGTVNHATLPPRGEGSNQNLGGQSDATAPA